MGGLGIFPACFNPRSLPAILLWVIQFLCQEESETLGKFLLYKKPLFFNKLKWLPQGQEKWSRDFLRGWHCLKKSHPIF